VFHPDGAFTTNRLVALAARLRTLGWTRSEVIRRVYSPFVIGGPAAWTNTWGAPRFGPAPGEVRTHEGQDVFCRYGDPVLAAERGIVEFDAGALGGKVARLRRRNGGYWYYAHLSGWNTRRFSSGDEVRPGDVIGYCGASGNARGGSPHVHFGWYGRDGAARDPMRHLVRWLRTATREARVLVARMQGWRARKVDSLTAARLFGDEFLPDRSDLAPVGVSLWPAGTTLARGAVGPVGAVLQAAVAAAALDQGARVPRAQELNS